MTVPLYLLGFPTPVVELVVGGVVLFLATAIYFGLNFSGLDEVDGYQDGSGQRTDRTTTGEDAD